MTVDGHDGDTVVVGSGDQHAYCSTGRPYAAAAGHLNDWITITVDAAACSSSPSDRLPAGTYEVRYNNRPSYVFDGTAWNAVHEEVKCKHPSNFLTESTLGTFEVREGFGQWTGQLILAGAPYFAPEGTAANICVIGPNIYSLGSPPGMEAPYRLLPPDSPPCADPDQAAGNDDSGFESPGGCDAQAGDDDVIVTHNATTDVDNARSAVGEKWPTAPTAALDGDGISLPETDVLAPAVADSLPAPAAVPQPSAALDSGLEAPAATASAPPPGFEPKDRGMYLVSDEAGRTEDCKQQMASTTNYFRKFCTSMYGFRGDSDRNHDYFLQKIYGYGYAEPGHKLGRIKIRVTAVDGGRLEGTDAVMPDVPETISSDKSSSYSLSFPLIAGMSGTATETYSVPSGIIYPWHASDAENMYHVSWMAMKDHPEQWRSAGAINAVRVAGVVRWQVAQPTAVLASSSGGTTDMPASAPKVEFRSPVKTCSTGGLLSRC